MRHPSSIRVETLFSGSTLTCGNGEESSPVPTEPNTARFVGVPGARISVPVQRRYLQWRSAP